MKVIDYPARDEWDEILKRPVFDTAALNEKVSSILADIKTNGDNAVRKYSALFDGAVLQNFQVTEEEIDSATKMVDSKLKNAIQNAAVNIAKFHESQKFNSTIIETSPGVKCWQKSVAIDKVGLYIPGGTAPLFSTVLMLAIPAKIAGCNEIILCTPPAKDGSVPPAILYAAKVAGITKVFKIGGVQAIGAMAYGTESVPKVYKIFGPGNQYVMAAKQHVSLADVSIDMPAGPSEVAIMADDSANAAFVASDLLSQAEHGADSQVILVTNSKQLVYNVQAELEKQLKQLPRAAIAIKAIENSRIILMESTAEMVELINQYAPEHLILSVENYTEIAELITNAGSVFLGNYTPESAGDYASGTNHTLPTNGWARSYSGVNLDSFIKKITFQEITKEGINTLGPIIEILAEAENLYAHKNAASLRINE